MHFIHDKRSVRWFTCIGEKKRQILYKKIKAIVLKLHSSKSFVPDSLAVDSTGNISVVSSTGDAPEVSACGPKKCGMQQPMTSY